MTNLSKLSRRHFLVQALKTSGVVVSTMALNACDDDDSQPAKPRGVGASFQHGIASGDPQANAVILWTRVTPDTAEQGEIEIAWEIAEDASFETKVMSGREKTNANRDYTFKVDAQGLDAGKRYFYRFITATETSDIGETKTLPEGSIDTAKFAVVSCSNYPAGYFNVYGEIAQQNDLDAVLHLGDYLYEYERGNYASENAAAMGREVLPEGEIIALDDYRMRYAQYRTDKQLQAAHALAPFICVWDDHEVANDTWREGAENHDDNEGSFEDRLSAALQAYAEWMPIRPPVNEEVATLSRNFEYGNLINLSMLDTRLVGRDQQLNMASYFTESGFDADGYTADVGHVSRTLLGSDQREWLLSQLTSGARWQVLGQQVLMGVMELPGAIATGKLTISRFAELGEIAGKFQIDPSSLTAEESDDLQNNGHLLALPSLPYNQDAWDGYPAERSAILEAANNANTNLVVLAGDTHNAWANNLTMDGSPVGVEFATASITSPGLESFLGLNTLEAVQQTEAGFVSLIEGLQYSNLRDRGYLALTFSQEKVEADFKYVDTISSQEYALITERRQVLSVNAGDKVLMPASTN